MTRILLLNRSTHQFIYGATPEQRQVLTQHRAEPLMEKRRLLLVGIVVVGVILREVVELLAVFIHTARTLLQVQEFLKLASHQAHRDVVPTKSRVEFGPWHLVAVLNGGGEVRPPSTRRSMKSLDREQGLLNLSAVQKTKLGLNDAKPVIRLQRINCLGKRWSVRHQEVGVGSLHPWLAVGRVHHMLHEVLHQHPHELLLHGQQLLKAHRRQRWRGSTVSSIAKLISCYPSMSVRWLRHILSEVASTRVHHLPEIACTISSQ
jgi:hypothetical protein